MTVKELIQRLQHEDPDWEVHMEAMSLGGVAMLITNLGVRTEIHWQRPVQDSLGVPIKGRYSQGF